MEKNKNIIVMGLMSGTSMDGINASVVTTNGTSLKTLNYYSISNYSENTIILLKTAINSPLNFIDDQNKMNKLSELVTIDHFNAGSKLLQNIKVEPELIGFHGQTIFHNPSKKSSIQIGNGQLLSSLFKKTVVCNFRENDIFNNGEGAPIAPIYHKHIIQENNFNLPCCIVNIGGISNLSFWDGSNLIGFDTGTGNCLMDYFVQKKLNEKYDKDGLIASKGKSNKHLVKKFLNDTFFSKKFPKSLDKNYFNYILNYFKDMDAPDILATLLDFTVQSIKESLFLLPSLPKQVIITGGGAKNKELIANLKKTFNNKIQIQTGNEVNINEEMIEAELIAFISARKIYDLPITFPNTTGVSKPLTGGKVFKF